ncbi:MAG: reverse transcriptase family protein, partial [Burkholderiales bacterium]
MQGSTIWSSLDLQQGYMQCRIKPEDIPTTAFCTPFGHYEWLVLPFGLANSPSLFQAMMTRILAPVSAFCMVYLDDIIIFSKSPQEHARHLRAVLSLLREQKMYVKMTKCTFNKAELNFLGHVVTRHGIKADPAKVSTVTQWPIPTDVSQVRSFLGLANYFRRYIQGYASIAAPLHDLTKEPVPPLKPDKRAKGNTASVPWQWSARHDIAFARLKKALTDAPVLALPDFSKPFEVIADASLLGVGAVLMQEGRPVAYYSRKLTPAERNYSTGEQELLAVYCALKEWRCYLEGPHVT